MCNLAVDDEDICMDRSPCTCAIRQCRSEHSTKHSSHTHLNNQIDGLFWHLGQVTPPTDKARDFNRTYLEQPGAFDTHFGNDSGPFPALLPSSDDDRLSTIPQCTGPTDPLNLPSRFPANNSLFGEPPFEAPDVHFNVDLSYSTAHLHSLLASPPLESSAESGPNSSSDFSMDYALGSDNSDDPTLDYSTLPNRLPAHNHIPSSSLSTLPFGSESSLNNPVTTPPPPTRMISCLAEGRPPCIITATRNLSLLHIRQNSCLSLQNRRSSYRSQAASGPELARMSGSVLKDNKDIGMSVCRMLQCGCALRPQNQVLLALLCSRLAVWYRATISACFSRRPGSSPGGEDHIDERRSSPEKVIYQAVTIGDHTVDDFPLDWDIQARVILKELGHLQRLVNNLSARIKQTGTSRSIGPDANANAPSFGLPAVAHDRLVAHLSREVEAAQNDLTTAWREQQKFQI